jgi:hypothetical protein
MELVAMSSGQSSQAGELVQFMVGGCLFGSGIFLFMNQVIVRSDVAASGMGRFWGRFGGLSVGGGQPFAWGTPGLGLLMIPLAIGVCLLFAGSFQRWARLLVWGSLAALFAGVLNSVRISLMPATLWQLAVYVVMIASGGGLMFRSLRAYEQAEDPSSKPRADFDDRRTQDQELRRELAELKRRLDNLQR